MKQHIHGAKWWKFDFHNHTPASNDFGKGNDAHKAISPENWLLMYMDAGIDCVAVTDHNSGEWIDLLKASLEILKKEKPEGFRELILFPGVEISTSGNIHILALFDPAAGTKEVQALLGSINFPAQHFGTSDAVSPKSVEEVINEIHKAGAVAIPAHVDEACGLFELKGFTLTQVLKTDGLLAIEILNKNAEKPDLFKQSKLEIAEVLGSDSHIAEQVGTKFTWVKMSEPSLNALKLALHDREDGIIRKEEATSDPNLIDSRYFIKSIKVANGFKAGNGAPLEASFSPWLTSVIGGRGSGKSTLVNYLRIALNRTDDMPAEVQQEFNKFNQIGRKNSAGMLREGTTITVEIVKDGQHYKIFWQNNTHTLFTWSGSAGDWDAGTIISNVSDLFPIQVFNQKELYALTGDPSKLIDLIDSQFDKQKWTEKKNDLVEKWLADRATERQLIAAISEEGNLKAQLDATNNKIALYESSEYKETLNTFNKLNATDKFFLDCDKTMSEFLSNLKDLKIKVPSFNVPENCTEVIDERSTSFVQKINTDLLAAREKILEALMILEPYNNDLEAQFHSLPWYNEFEKSKTSYSAIVDKIQKLGSESYEVLIQRRNELNAKVSSVALKKERLEQLQESLNQTYESLLLVEGELREMRKGVIKRWKDVDKTENPFLMIELHPMADTEQANNSFRKLLRKEGSEFSGYIYNYDEESGSSSGLIGNIVNEPELTRWDKRREEIRRFTSANESDAKGLDLRLVKHLEGLKRSTPEDIDRLMIWIPEDKLVLKFKKQGKAEDIQTGSAGERTAGMLGLLLALNDTPLIIDQPEDDLDTRLISNFVVSGFKTLKKNRQLLLVTHNPNIAVNANSDNIVYMNYQTGQITVSGNNALQDREIRLAVCDVMEGGADALNKRYYRISKALN